MPRMTKQERELTAVYDRLEEMERFNSALHKRCEVAEKREAETAAQLVDANDLVRIKERELASSAARIDTLSRTMTLNRLLTQELTMKLAFAEGYIAAQKGSYVDGVKEREDMKVIDLGAETPEERSRDDMRRDAVNAMQAARGRYR